MNEREQGNVKKNQSWWTPHEIKVHALLSPISKYNGAHMRKLWKIEKIERTNGTKKKVENEQQWNDEPKIRLNLKSADKQRKIKKSCVWQEPTRKNWTGTKANGRWTDKNLFPRENWRMRKRKMIETRHSNQLSEDCEQNINWYWRRYEINFF
jgi:hypothetical protein